ncbi:hypothetical protein ACKKBG_A11570 [Auxenochlorella protothecoides x Auxenochlorella symbiontica]
MGLLLAVITATPTSADDISITVDFARCDMHDPRETVCVYSVTTSDLIPKSVDVVFDMDSGQVSEGFIPHDLTHVGKIVFGTRPTKGSAYAYFYDATGKQITSPSIAVTPLPPSSPPPPPVPSPPPTPLAPPPPYTTISVVSARCAWAGIMHSVQFQYDVLLKHKVPQVHVVFKLGIFDFGTAYTPATLEQSGQFVASAVETLEGYAYAYYFDEYGNKINSPPTPVVQFTHPPPPNRSTSSSPTTTTTTSAKKSPHATRKALPSP